MPCVYIYNILANTFIQFYARVGVCLIVRFMGSFPVEAIFMALCYCSFQCDTSVVYFNRNDQGKAQSETKKFTLQIPRWEKLN